VEVSSTRSSTSALDGGECLTSRPGLFTPRERAPGTHWIEGWVGPRAVLDAVVKRKIPSPRRESNRRTLIVQPVAQPWTWKYYVTCRCTDITLSSWEEMQACNSILPTELSIQLLFSRWQRLPALIFFCFDVSNEIWREKNIRRAKSRGEDVMMDPRETGWEVVNWIHLAQERGRWRALVNMVMKLRFPQKLGRGFIDGLSCC
jgi:hypothetical protein